MTGPEDSNGNTRPISVAELLAKNGTIGAPPVGGRRRRRRGNSDAVTVAELTGEIPIIAVHPADEPEEPPAEKPAEKDRPARSDDTEVVSAVPDVSDETNDVSDETDEVSDETNGAEVAEATTDATIETESEADPEAAAEADYQAHLDAREADPEPVEFKPSSCRPQYPNPLRDYRPSGTGAERMSPDFLEETEAEESSSDDDHDDDHDDRPSYLGPLFGGRSVAGDAARRPGRPGPEDIDLEDHDDHEELDKREELDDHEELDERDEAGARPGGSSLVRGLWVVGQCIIAVAFGAGLFIAFDQLWKWNTIVALV